MPTERKMKKVQENDHKHYRIFWSDEDEAYVGVCDEFPSLSWVADTPEDALRGIRHVVTDVIKDQENQRVQEAQKDWSLAFYLHKMGGIEEPWAYRDPHLWRDKLEDGLWHCMIESVGGPIMETTAETPTDAVKQCYEKMIQLQKEKQTL